MVSPGATDGPATGDEDRAISNPAHGFAGGQGERQGGKEEEVRRWWGKLNAQNLASSDAPSLKNKGRNELSRQLETVSQSVSQLVSLSVS